MKKMTLFLAITGFAVAASAQQNDFFDIQKHLQKKRKENKQAIKPLLVKPLFQNKVTVFQPSNSYHQRKFSHLLANGDKVYLLVQDNMPCVIPDMKQFNMLNISGGHHNSYTPFLRKDIPGTIPNAATLGKIITTR